MTKRRSGDIPALPLLWVVLIVLLWTHQQFLQSSENTRPTREDVLDSSTAAASRRLEATPTKEGDTECELSPARYSNAPIRPVLLASYPGSGSQMTRILISQLTHIQTKSMWDPSDQRDRAVAIKTHYPFSGGDEYLALTEDIQFDRAILILRSPLQAIPSFFNQLYERRHNLPTHTQRGPTEEWIRFRDNKGRGKKMVSRSFSLVLCDLFLHLPGLDHYIEEYENFIVHWMDGYSLQKRLLITSFETLTNENSGVFQAKRIANWLNRLDGVDVINQKYVPCLWRKVINHGRYRIDDISRDKSREKKEWLPMSTMRRGPSRRAYTVENLKVMTASLERLRTRYLDNIQFVNLMEAYIKAVADTKPEITPDGTGSAIEDILALKIAD